MSQITSHVLDTSRGLPAQGITVIFYREVKNDWTEIGSCVTNKEGRITDLLAKNIVLQNGTYKLKFLTAEYFNALHVPTFYPFIEIIFDITTQEHYHIPLLLNPFGYSTYRGS